MRAFIALCLLVVNANQAQGQDSQPAREEIEEFYEEMVVYAGVPAPGDPMAQAARIDTLEGLELERRVTASLGQTLEYMAGVRSLDTGNNAGIPVVRGLTGNRVGILSNGIDVDHQQFGIRHQPNIEPFLSNRIEVVRGPASSVYGSDAIGGFIDVHGLPLAHTDDGKRDSTLDARVDYASNNNQRDIALHGASNGDRFTIAAGFIWREGDEIEAPDSPIGLRNSAMAVIRPSPGL